MQALKQEPYRKPLMQKGGYTAPRTKATTDVCKARNIDFGAVAIHNLVEVRHVRLLAESQKRLD